MPKNGKILDNLLVSKLLDNQVRKHTRYARAEKTYSIALIENILDNLVQNILDKLGSRTYSITN